MLPRASHIKHVLKQSANFNRVFSAGIKGMANGRVSYKISGEREKVCAYIESSLMSLLNFLRWTIGHTLAGTLSDGLYH